MRKHFPLVLALLLAGAAFGPVSSAWAEGSTPGFQLPQIITPEDVSSLSVDFDDAFNTIPNNYLSDSMKLNYQISLLEKMVERQSALDKVGDSFDKLGVDFDAPPPPRGICAQLPANAPCLKAYPDLYGELVSSRKAYYEELNAKATGALSGTNMGASDQENAEAKAAREKAEAERKEREAKKERQERYRWSNVSCVIGQCHGVIVSGKDDGFRATVRKGMRLPDNTLVQDISATGIRVSIDGDSIALRPAPGDSSVATNADGTPATANEMGGLAPDGLQKGDGGVELVPDDSTQYGPIAKTATPTPDVSTPAGQTSVEPALGPSGLF